MDQFAQLFQGIANFHWQYIIMYFIGGGLIYLAIKKDYEPMLLLPIGFGAILVNLPLSSIWEYEGTPGVLQIFYNSGILTEIFPVLIFVAVGAMIDFTPLLQNPKMLFFGAAAQFGIFFTTLAALYLNTLFPSLGFDLKTAASIGIIGAADGPTSIFVASKFAKEWLGPISVAAYSYMALVPVIQPPVIRALTTKNERLIRMPYKEVKISRTVLIAFPILITIIAGIIAPISVPLVGLLMFGNLIRESSVLERLSKAAQNELANLVTLLLGITIGATMHYDKFLDVKTLLIMAMGLVAFVFDTAGGVLFAKLLNLFTKEKVNPMVGAAGISAFPMSARVIQRMAKQEDPHNFILMQAVSANVAGQLGSIVAGGMVLALVPWLLMK
ncbi:sodium ion-translocating decarboxylase subunit beta [Fusibacter bizertensis]|uniref:Sodium ion-translocating decarboxylase subunit beta n=1 Tax=Fusibacter bizertensis TaxID=1488331 RepID=A0ABT6NBJ5_9FIRM|nr:sodium ion-translocating decarboxylase subunit beta [Fusibacter bizertensis]MDH8677781.1 sodium ion-translocating decarboxylase subunit beta [Fusibacter bizertensis]